MPLTWSASKRSVCSAAVAARGRPAVGQRRGQEIRSELGDPLRTWNATAGGGWLGQAGLWPAQPPDGMPRHSVLGTFLSGCDPSHPDLAFNRQAIEDLFLGSVADHCSFSHFPIREWEFR